MGEVIHFARASRRAAERELERYFGLPPGSAKQLDPEFWTQSKFDQAMGRSDLIQFAKTGAPPEIS